MTNQALLSAALALFALCQQAHGTSPATTKAKATESKAKVIVLKKKGLTKLKVKYLCKGQKKLQVDYQVNTKGEPESAEATLDNKKQPLKKTGKANRYTVNFSHGVYSLSLDKTKLPVTAAPIMVFKTIPAAAATKNLSKTPKGGKLSPKGKAKLAKLKNGTRIMYSGCRPKA